jgi:hypothetical protein
MSRTEHAVEYEEHRWQLCGDLKVVALWFVFLPSIAAPSVTGLWSKRTPYFLQTEQPEASFFPGMKIYFYVIRQSSISVFSIAFKSEPN